MQNKVKSIDFREIKVANRFRKDLGDITGLVNSIKTHGLINPILIDEDSNLIAGERRYTAIKTINEGGTQMLALVRVCRSDDPLVKAEMEVDENLHRKDFTWIETVRSIYDIHMKRIAVHGVATPGRGEGGWRVEDTANRFGLDKTHVGRYLMLAKALETEGYEDVSKAKSADEALKIVRAIMQKHRMEELGRRSQVKVVSGETSGEVEEDDWTGDDEDEAYKDVGLDVSEETASTSSPRLPVAKAVKPVKAKEKTLTINDILKHGDARELMAKLPDKSINVVFTDPPWFVGIGDAVRDPGMAGKDAEWDNATLEDGLGWFIPEVFRVLTDPGWFIIYFGHQHYDPLFKMLTSAGFYVDPFPGLWVKPGGQVNQPNLYNARCYEPMFWCRKGSACLSVRGKNNVFPFTPVAASQKRHRFEKPIDLSTEILSRVAVPGLIMLDPFAGSANSLVAAYRVGMRPMGFELGLAEYGMGVDTLNRELVTSAPRPMERGCKTCKKQETGECHTPNPVPDGWKPCTKLTGNHLWEPMDLAEMPKAN